MAIKTDPKLETQSRSQAIQQYAEQQARLQEEQRQRESISQSQTRLAAPDAVQPATEERLRSDENPGLQRADDPMVVQEAAVAEPEASGQERSDEAVETASLQEGKAERWQRFAEEQKGHEIPPSIEAQAAGEQQEAQQREQQQINIGDLIKEMSIQGGKIDA